MFTPAESFLRLSRIKGKQVVQILHNVYNILTVVEHSMGMISALYRKTTTDNSLFLYFLPTVYTVDRVSVAIKITKLAIKIMIK